VKHVYRIRVDVEVLALAEAFAGKVVSQIPGAFDVVVVDMVPDGDANPCLQGQFHVLQDLIICTALVPRTDALAVVNIFGSIQGNLKKAYFSGTEQVHEVVKVYCIGDRAERISSSQSLLEDVFDDRQRFQHQRFATI